MWWLKLAVYCVGLACGRVGVVYWSVGVADHSVVVRLTFVGTSDLTWFNCTK